MQGDPRGLMDAVIRACGRDLDPRRLGDRLALQWGCYILNSRGVGPIYDFELYIRGPYSRDLADDMYEAADAADDVPAVPVEFVDRLSRIFGRGPAFAEAYATVFLIRNNSPRASHEDVMRRALDLKPDLRDEVMEACAEILCRCSRCFCHGGVWTIP